MAIVPTGQPHAREKLGDPTGLELTEQPRQAVDDYIKSAGKKPGEFLFTARRRQEDRMTTHPYARLQFEWITGIKLDSTAARWSSFIRRPDSSLD
jgi:hypothetical protein